MKMKKSAFLTGACLLVAGMMFVSCEKEEGSGAGGNEKAKILATVDMLPTSQVSYLLPIQDISASNPTFDEAQEIKTSNYIVPYKDWVFIVEGMSGGDVRKFSRNDDGTLTELGRINVGGASATVSHVCVISDTKAYATAMMDNKIVIFNPTTMQKTGEIDVAGKGYGINQNDTPNPMGMFLRDGVVFCGLGQFSQPPMAVDKGAYMLLINAETDQIIKMISDNRLTSATAIGESGMFLDEKNDLYIPCWGSYGFNPEHHSGLLRIKSGQTDFDPDYCFQLTGRELPEVQGGKLQYVMNYHYAGNGDVYFFGYCPAFASTPADFVNDKTNYSFKGNIYDCTANVLDLPRSNAYSCAINHYGDKVLFGVVSESNGVGLFAYDRKNGECSTSPVINIQGSILSLKIFD